MLVNLFEKFNCECSLSCINTAKCLADLYFNYWIGKTDILNDNKNILTDIFDILNFKVMENGVIPVLVDYGNNITITQIQEIWYDKNYQPILAIVRISKPNNNFELLKVADWKLFLDENKILKEITFKEVGYGFDSDEIIYKCIFFQNNFSQIPSLEYLCAILKNIHSVDISNCRNQEIRDLIYTIESNEKFTEHQLENFGYVISKDNRGLLSVTLDSPDDNRNYKKELVTNDMSKWPNLKDELRYWIDLFFDFAGMAKEKLSENRENLPETYNRNARVSVIEKQFYKFRKKFVEQINLYFKTNIEIDFDTSIPDYISQMNKQPSNTSDLVNNGGNNEPNQN